MDKRGNVLVLDESDRVVQRLPRVPVISRGHLVLAALEAGSAAGWPEWWPELAPLTAEERTYVR
jgi:hypothetical protein